MNVALIDYGAGNLRSVANALRELGVEPHLVTTPDGLENASHLVLPGVGSFGDCMDQLGRRDLVAPIREWVAAGKPYLGICLGYQILFDASDESPGVGGLGVFRGLVRRFREEPGLKIPHMGWNAARISQPGTGLWNGLGPEPFFYFVHSYFPVPDDPRLIAAGTTHGSQAFASAVEAPGLLACQFHPEKSQSAGLRLIANFIGRTPPGT